MYIYTHTLYKYIYTYTLYIYIYIYIYIYKDIFYLIKNYISVQSTRIFTCIHYYPKPFPSLYNITLKDKLLFIY